MEVGVAGAGVIDDYVARLSRTLSGPRGPKLDMVTEARDSLLDTAEALELDGLGRAEAERVAVEEFGPVEEIAPGYQEELSISAGRRLAALLFISVPLTIMAWSLVWRFSSQDPIAYERWPAWFMPVSRGLDYLQLAVALLGGAGLFALGRGLRRIRRPRLVTRSLGVLVLIVLPVTGALGLLLTYGAQRDDFFDHPLNLGVETLSLGLSLLQLYGAARCLMITRRRRAPVLGRS
ncbi:permease prefix domain 1-containing protein [Streptosporangium sp. NPDC001559]|uniref:permease prefix domain 1-containing protein n=1 Tax=Streptosporangium sp. NPDC001559 TaxID=3366187 RepID=UPI0036EBFAAE